MTKPPRKFPKEGISGRNSGATRMAKHKAKVREAMIPRKWGKMKVKVTQLCQTIQSVEFSTPEYHSRENSTFVSPCLPITWPQM